MDKKLELFSAKITHKNEIQTNFFAIDIEYALPYKAGQVVAITNSKELEPRLYSIAGSFADNTIRIVFDVHQDGKLTPMLSRLSEGENLQISKPFGRFIGTDEPAWWIATGTGIAPFIAMSQQLAYHNKQLIHGARTIDGFLFKELFEKWLGDRYIKCCTTEVAENVYFGRLTNWLKEQKELPLDIKYYLCGNPEMVVEVRDILVSKGISFNNIISEIYF